MCLVDTSVWVNHLRTGVPRLAKLLNDNQVATHPFVVGELACGNLTHRGEILTLLQSLPAVQRVSDDEILYLLDKHALAGKGLGLIDMHLLASSMLSGKLLWTEDHRLNDAAKKLGVAYP